MKKILLFVVLLIIILTGCQRGDFRASIVFEGQAVPHEGYFISQKWYLLVGDIAPANGYVVWINGLEPTDMTGGD